MLVIGAAMPALQVRDFPQDLYDGLKRCAEAEHRSLAQQTIQAVEEMLRTRNEASAPRPTSIFEPDTEEARHNRIEERKALFAEIRKFAATLPPDLPDVVEMCRESREELEQRGDEIFERLTKGYL